MRKLFLIVSVFLFCKGVTGQHIRLSLNSGYGLYQFNDLKGLQNDLKNYSAFPDESVEKFPGYFNYSASMEYQLNATCYFGITGSYFTTGGRNEVRDYSGEYKVDMPVNGYGLGLMFRNIFSSQKRFDFYFRVTGGIIITNLNITETLNIYNLYSSSDSYKYNALPVFAEPDVGIFYKLSERFSADFYMGYQVNFIGKFHSAENESSLYDSKGEAVKANWSGLRLSLGISLNFFIKDHLTNTQYQ